MARLERTCLFLLAFLYAALIIGPIRSLTIVKGPKTAVVRFGEPVELSCVFDQEVDCYWFFEFDPFCNYDKNVQFLSQNVSYGEKLDHMADIDCSLRILNFKPEEIGRWFCYGRSIEYGDVAFSEVAFISVESLNFGLKLEQGPEDMTISQGDNITISCVFNYPVSCEWYRGDEFFIKLTKIQKDCSLKIEVQQRDFGRWRCTGTFSTSKTKYGYSTSCKIPISLSSDAVISELVDSSRIGTDGIRLVEISNNLTVKAGWDFHLNCIFSEPVSCKWILRQTVLSHRIYPSQRDPQKNCSFTVYSAKDEDIGPWQCRGTIGSAVVYSPVIWITVDSGQRNLIVVEHPQDRHVGLGESVILPCTFNQKVHCCWSRNNQTITLFLNVVKRTNCSLNVPAINLRDMGEYQCRGMSSDMEVMSTKAKLILRHSEMSQLMIVKEPAGGKFRYHQSVTLSCTFNQPAECHWIKDGNKLCSVYSPGSYTISNATTRCVYVIDVLTRSDLGVYHCWGNSNGTGKIIVSSPANISAHDRIYLRLVSEPSNRTVDIGRDLSLTCVFDSQVDCFWFHNDTLVNFRSGEYIDGGRRYSSYSNQTPILRKSKICSFRISSMRSDDFGLWQCKGVFSETGETLVSNVAKITHYRKGSDPLIVLETNPEDFDIKCISDRGNPAPELIWHLNGVRYPGISVVQKIEEDLYSTELKWDKSISLPGNTNALNCSMKQIHLYSRVPQNWIGNREDSIWLYQKGAIYAGVVTHPDHSEYKLENESVTFTCKFNATVDCQWIQDGRLPYAPGCNDNYKFLVNCGYSTIDCSITIVSVKAADAGKWICRGVYGYKKYLDSNPVNLNVLRPMTDPRKQQNE